MMKEFNSKRFKFNMSKKEYGKVHMVIKFLEELASSADPNKQVSKETLQVFYKDLLKFAFDVSIVDWEHYESAVDCFDLIEDDPKVNEFRETLWKYEEDMSISAFLELLNQLESCMQDDEEHEIDLLIKEGFNDKCITEIGE